MTIEINSVRYWLALPVPVVLVRVCKEPLEIYWLDVREFLQKKDLIYSIYQSKKNSVYFSFKDARSLPEYTSDLLELGLDHQLNVADMRINAEHDINSQFWGCVVMVDMFDNNPDKWIKYLREKGSKNQLIDDLPFAFWVKEQSEEDSDFLNRVKKMVDMHPF